jgi:transposase
MSIVAPTTTSSLPEITLEPGLRSALAPLYIGIDVGKKSHAVGFLVPSSRKSQQKPPKCVIKRIANSRAGFEALLELIKSYRGTFQECHVLLESTGHYGRSLEQFLQEQGVRVYRVAAREKYNKASKTDESDARSLALLLHNQIGLGVSVLDEADRIHLIAAPSQEARQLRPLITHRYELTQSETRYENRLIAIMDEVFPEICQLWKDVNSISILHLREQFSTPESVVSATLEGLCDSRKSNHPGRAKLAQLQEVAATSIGTKDTYRRGSLLIEQRQLIAQLRMARRDIAELETAIERIVGGSRVGMILCSLPGVGPTQVGEIIALVGDIHNFDGVGDLRRYCGWAPVQKQTGTSYNHTHLGKGGNRILKRSLFLITLRVVQVEPWKSLHTRLVQRMCYWDEKKGKYVGKMKVIARIAGQLVRVIYSLLWRDARIVERARAAGKEPPPPQLYDASRHSIHRH